MPLIVQQWDKIADSPGFIPIPLMSLRETSSLDVGNLAAHGGILASDSTPILEAINAATDGAQRVHWAAGNNDQVTFQTALPPDFDASKDLELHARLASGGTTDAVALTLASYFGEADTAVADTSASNQTTTFAEKIATIAAVDIPDDPQTFTCGLTPVTHATDAMYLTALWLEYTRYYLVNTNYVCRLVIPRAHKLLKAWVYVQNVVFTGTVEVRLRMTDRLGARGGSDIAELVDNDDLTARSSINARYDFVLLDFAKEQAPAERMYFLSLSGTNPADRFDEPLLVLEYD